MKQESAAIFSIPEWEKIDFLAHGFGKGDWNWSDFGAHSRLCNFMPLSLCQVHSDILHFVKSVPETTLVGDALLTDRPGILLVVKTADCLPILIVDKNRRAIAAVHCGWKSTSKKLAQKVVQGMEEHYHSDPSSLMVAFGPCIEKDCYEVGEDVKREFEERGTGKNVFSPHSLHEGKYCLDIRLANKIQLLGSGVKHSNMSEIKLCTYCETTLLSYRRSHQIEGRMLSFIGIVRPIE
jgi:YfiH family protein